MKYRFGQITIDADARTAETAEGSIHLTRKAFDLLLLLIEHRPNAVTKDQIYARLWPDTFVAESNLQTLVHEIRQAIDYAGTDRSWIRTVHGIGYSFTGTALASEAAAPNARATRPAAWLVGESARVALHAGENVLGRGDDVIEIEGPTISRRHARITIADAVTIEDLGSKNGTWVEGERVVTPRVLRDGEVVRMGSAIFRFQLVRTPRVTESADAPD